ncbi:MAG: PilZ domain-containing protein, partial [Planctomycetes bacterium]|nr:PilZ domain-containing protein [Planctomycetota bacterium]
PQLNFRQGRYYYVPAVRANMLQGQRHQQSMQRAIRRLVREHKLVADLQNERRRQGRVQFVHPVTVHTADNRVLRFLSRDISVSGLCLIGSCNLLGQRVLVQVPGANSGGPALCFRVQILWTHEVGDNLFENGGIFLKLVSEEGPVGKS